MHKLPDGSATMVVELSGSVDGTTVRAFIDKLTSYLNQDIRHLILEFSQVRYINSTAMGLMVRWSGDLQEKGGSLKVVGAHEKLLALFDMLGLLSLIPMYKSCEEALAACETQGVPRVVQDIRAALSRILELMPPDDRMKDEG
jgi:anti-anti-sigma factor